MQRFSRSVPVRLMAIHGCTLLAFGLALFYIRAFMTNRLFNVFGGAIAILLEVASLLFLAGVDWMLATGVGRHQFRSLRGLLVTTIAIAAGSFIEALYPGSSTRDFCYLVAAYAFVLSLGKLKLAGIWKDGAPEKIAMLGLAGVALTFSACLTRAATQQKPACLAAIASYATFMGFQVLLTIPFLRRQEAKARRASVIGAHSI